MAPEVRAAIRRVVTSPEGYGLSPVDIRRLLQGRKECEGRVPSLRSIQREVAKYRPPETSGPWSLADADPEDAALVLPVLAEAIERGRGHWQRFSKDLAAWIVKVRVAAPDIPPLWTLYVAQEYLVREYRKEPVEGLDQMLAFAPWREKPQLFRYLRAINSIHPAWFAECVESLGSLATFPEPLWLFLGRAQQHVLRGEPGAVGVLIALECWEAQEEKGAPDGQTREC